MKNNFIKSENFTKWAIRKVSVGVVSAAIASGIFIVVGSGEAHASDLQDKAPVVQNVENKQVDDSTESKVIENKVNTVGKETKQVEKSTVEAKNVVSAEKQPEVKSEKEVSIESKETDVNNLIKQAKDVAEPQTTPVEVKKAVMENTKDTVDVQAKYLDKANFPGPFTAGVNQVIPYEFFGGDGMLTRLILKSSDKAPWSDNGSAKNPALLPLEKLGKGLYFYEVDLEGTKGKSDKELLDLLKENGTQSYKATIKVYGEKDGKADLTNVVATKDIDVNLNGLTSVQEVKKAVMENTKDTVDVQAKYLDKANFPGPFTAGVNQVIPYEFFGGDGMLTRLILKSSDKAPWSDNGSAKNPALLPLEKLGKGLYFYEVDLEGTKGKSDKELLDLLKENGTQSYKATIKVYGEKDGKADLTNVVATKDIDVNLNGLTSVQEVKKAVMENTKDTVDVQAKYLDKANFPGPFTAGVNQVIPYEFFGGDGMLTRLILKSSDKAPWSDNGSAKNPALPPVEKLGHGLYFYEVDLAGTQGKQDKELLDLLKANGTQSYKATIKVYSEKDGKADLTNLVATKEVTINLHKETNQMDMKPGEDMMQNNTATGSMNSNVSGKVMNMSKSDNMSMESSMNKAMMPENMTMDSHMNKDMMQDNMTMNTHMSNGMMKKGMLPKTSAAPEGTMSSTNSSNTGILGLIIASFLGLLGFRRKNN